MSLRVSAALVVLSSATDITATEQDDAAQLNELAESVDHPTWELAVRERAYRAAHESEHPAAVRAMFAQKWLALALELGLTKQALAVWESLPASWRYRTLDSSLNPDARSHHRRVTDQHADLDMDLAAASILEGRLDLARQLVAGVASKLATARQPTGDADSGTGAAGYPIPRPTRWERPEYDDDTARLAILQECLEPSETDAFDLLVGVMATSVDHGPWFRFGTWERLLAVLADRKGYPSLARYLRRSATWKLDDEWWHLPDLPDAVKTPELIAAATRAEDSINGLRARLLQQVPPRSAATSRSPVDETVRRLIGAPKIVELHERPLPKGIVPIAMTYEQERDHREALRSEHDLPFPHEIVRVEARGDRVVAVGAAQDYDPVGELSRGAYWVFRSEDGGASWGPPLYTGLRITMPYVVRPRSDLPMIRRSGLRIEVEVRELDLDQITFPPLFTRTKREALGLCLDLPWELLERDSDGDGLTDLAEERLITDPHQADTDADGSDDGVDPLPQVPHRVGTDDRTNG